LYNYGINLRLILTIVGQNPLATKVQTHTIFLKVPRRLEKLLGQFEEEEKTTFATIYYH
jgi:hypothetical protein